MVQPTGWVLAALSGTGYGWAPAALHWAAASEPANNGFTIAIAVMVLMVLALVYVIWSVLRGQNAGAASWPRWTDVLVPVLAVAGLGVAGYLTFIETQNVQPICGPIGDCASVQSSPYARLFGFFPVGLLGLLGYIAIIAAWAVGRYGIGQLAHLGRLAAFAMAVFGVIFALYLTYLEPFVIKAVCAWCLSNAVLITLVMLFSLPPALSALSAGEEDLDEAWRGEAE